MGIFNGNSIYNDGGAGGGGGYNDGGQIVDGDFMKIENNAVSTYDNVNNRDTLNFYLEPGDGEQLNAVVELTTAVNSTVNVYVLQNGLYYLLGNVGGNTIAAGNDYKVNIIGNSYSVEQVSGNLTLEYVDINGVNIKVKKLGSRYWTVENVNNIIISDFKERNGQRYYKHDSVKDVEINGFHVPEQIAFNELLSVYGNDALRSTDMWSTVAGSNTSGFDAKPYGVIRNDNINESYTEMAFFVSKDSGHFYLSYGGQGYSVSNNYATLRLCKDV